MLGTPELTSVPTNTDIYVALVQHIEREKDMHDKVDKLYKTTVTGNGIPPLVEQVRRHGDWIGGVNKIVWIVASLLIGQIVLGGCSVLFALVMLLNNFGLLAP